MTSLKRTIAQTPVLGRALLTVKRAGIAFAYFRQPLAQLGAWLLRSRELSNFTYALQPDNERYLAAIVAHAARVPYERAFSYVRELEEDEALRQHIARATRASEHAFMADDAVHYGRRAGWYAFVRATRPRLVVETGVDKGLGACVLAAAVLRNRAEGFPGRYLGTDIDRSAGYLLTAPYRDAGAILYGDSIASLQGLEDGSVDLFINDSDHSAEYEAREYATMTRKLAPGAVVLGDNAHVSSKLLDFSLASGREFVFFAERPRNHWYPGAGIGISFEKR